MITLCIATNNEHKLKEVKAMLPDGYKLLSLKDIGCDIELPEEQTTIRGNAQQKASYVKVHFGVDCFADDTGLEVEALNGAPGVYSARYAGPEADDQENCKKLIQELTGEENRKARFRTVICLFRENEVHYFEGIVDGTITEEGIGVQGFGYDPIFIPDGYNQTFAQMSEQQKNQISHRGRAVRKLVDFLHQGA
ncbi:MAG: non-canonical purine NTP pyrophosphatase [Cyclobacteriaceae bacterium]|nr:MAG: non-canonical purine NTP pyrophosphatase [Cyclobacteriaceae bacterium]